MRWRKRERERNYSPHKTVVLSLKPDDATIIK